MNLIKRFSILTLLLSLSVFLSCSGHTEDSHDHSTQAETDIDHVNEDQENEDDHAGTDVFLSDAQQQQAGIKLATATLGSIPETRRIYGEIRLNEDKVIHQYPKYPGVVQDIRVNIGQAVTTGDTLAMIFNTETLSLYPVVSAIQGEILEKHAVEGAVIHGADPLLVIGNLESVWVDLHVFEKDRGLIRKGQTVTLHSINGTDHVTTRVSYIKPVMDAETRTYLVRCSIGNRSRNWNPGRFVYGEIEFDAKQAQSLIVPANSVQNYESDQVVFIPEGSNVFEVIPVITGRKANGLVEIIGGIKQGDQIVSDGAFFLKSALVTSSFSGHAGHGH